MVTAVLWSNATEVTYVVDTGTRELGDLLVEGERGQYTNKQVIAEQDQGVN